MVEIIERDIKATKEKKSEQIKTLLESMATDLNGQQYSCNILFIRKYSRVKSFLNSLLFTPLELPAWQIVDENGGVICTAYDGLYYELDGKYAMHFQVTDEKVKPIVKTHLERYAQQQGIERIILTNKK